VTVPPPGFLHRPNDDSIQEQLQTLLQMHSGLGVVLWLRDLKEERLLYVSPAFEKIWGRPVETLLANPRIWIESMVPEDRAKVMSKALNEGRSGGPDSVEYRIQRPDGTIRRIRDRAYPILNALGKVVRLAGMAEDVTDQA
jgi:PAS domain S-box-containing protein